MFLYHPILFSLFFLFNSANSEIIESMHLFLQICIVALALVPQNLKNYLGLRKF